MGAIRTINQIIELAEELKEDYEEIEELNGEIDGLKDKIRILEEENEEILKKNVISSGNAIYDDYIATELSRIINKYGAVKTTELLESII